MVKVVDLREYRRKARTDRIFGPWMKRFGESYREECRLEDLSDRTLYSLARPGEESTDAFYEIIMRTKSLGEGADFGILDKGIQLMVVDVHLFLADQIRFEMMRRLGWLVDFDCRGTTLVELIRQADDLKTKCRSVPPKLSASHDKYREFQNLAVIERESFIRRMLPEALETFARKI